MANYLEDGRVRDPKLISPGRLLRRSEQLSIAIGESSRTANDVLGPFGSRVIVPDLTSQSVVGFAEFLNHHIFRALSVSAAAELIARSHDIRERGKIRRLFISNLCRGGQVGLQVVLPWSDQSKLKGVEILASDRHFMEHYQPVLFSLDSLGNKVEGLIAFAAEARGKALDNQSKIAQAYLRGASEARATHRHATAKRVQFDLLTETLNAMISQHVDIVEHAELDGLIRRADRVSREESGSRIKEAIARDRANTALVSFLPALSATENITSGEASLYLLDQMVNSAFLFSVACYETDIAVAIQQASASTVQAFRVFMHQAFERRKLLLTSIQKMKEIAKPTDIEEGNGREI